MTTFTKDITIEASKREIWSIVSDLGDIFKFNAGVCKSYYTSKYKHGVGASRICELQPAGKVEEVVTKWIEGKSFTLRIDPIEKTPPVKDFYASLSLEEISDSKTRVKCTIEYKTKLGFVGKLLNGLIIQSQMEKAIDALLNGLKLHTEKGVEILDGKTLNNLLKAA
jgi:hypothetical protein